MTRVNELLKREIAEDLMRMQPSGFSMSNITVTRVDVAPDLRSATAYVSIFNEDDETSVNAVRYLNKNHGYIQKMVSSRVKLKYTPKLSFKADTSLVEGDSVLNMLADMEASQPEVFAVKKEVKEDGI